MEEISTSFCFICLLHLANEQGLKLQSSKKSSADATTDGEEDTTEADSEKIGNIWELAVRYDGRFSFPLPYDLFSRCTGIRMLSQHHNYYDSPARCLLFVLLPRFTVLVIGIYLLYNLGSKSSRPSDATNLPLCSE
jgi:hypothetical protein